MEAGGGAEQPAAARHLSAAPGTSPASTRGGRQSSRAAHAAPRGGQRPAVLREAVVAGTPLRCAEGEPGVAPQP